MKHSSSHGISKQTGEGQAHWCVRTLQEELVHDELVLCDLVQQGGRGGACRLRGYRRPRRRHALGLHSLLLLHAHLDASGTQST